MKDRERVIEAVVVVCCCICSDEGATRREEFRARPLLCAHCYGILRAHGACASCGDPGTRRRWRQNRRVVESVQCDACWNRRVAGETVGAFVGEFFGRILK